MKITKRILALVLCLSLVLGMAGCKKDDAQPEAVQTKPAQTQAPVLSAEELYSAARAAVDGASDLSVRVAVEKTTIAGSETLTESSHQVISLTGRGTDSAKVLLSEMLTYGEDYYSVAYQDVYADGKLYSLVDGTYRFACEKDAASYQETLTPAVLLDASLYGAMEAEENGGMTTITFTAPSAAETWALPEGAQLVEATGTAVVKADGSLHKTSYTITYTYGAARITVQYDAVPELKTTEILIPADADKYVVMDDVLPVRMSETACGNLAQLNQISSTVSETMTCLAAAMVRTETTSVDLAVADEFVASVDTNVSVVDYATNESDTYTQEERFLDGYTIREDGGDRESDDSVDAAGMYEYCMDNLLYGMTALDYWKNAEIKDLGEVYLVECTYSDDLAEDLRSDICTTILGAADALDAYSPVSTIAGVNGYFAVDKYTGLPTAASYGYAGTDVIDEQTYAIGIQTTQSYQVPTEGAYYAVTGKMPAEEAPENPATPLLYHVTGADGQEMYLMGTIHIGDNRTAYLPQEVYDALSKSSALAVEFDLVDFEKKLETDEALMAAAAANYYYLDGTTVVDHADTELLTKAEDYMKATGNYSSSIVMMKPISWSQSIEDFYLRQGYSLSGEKGVDRRLIHYAYDNDIMVVDVESAEAQMEMLGGFSDELQELLLEQALSYEPGEYWQDAAELFEMWCRGDEAELIAYLNDDSEEAELTEEEKALYEEYNDAMIIERNDTMLEEALAYLETDHTIFFAVGLAHLLQENGLVEGLRDAGFTVELVAYN